MVVGVKPQLAATSHTGACLSSCSFTFETSFLLVHLGRGGDNPVTWAPAAHVGNPGRVPASWNWADPVCAIAVI